MQDLTVWAITDDEEVVNDPKKAGSPFLIATFGKNSMLPRFKIIEVFGNSTCCVSAKGTRTTDLH